MSEQRVSGRYAKSLIDLSIEQKKLEVIYADMLALQATLEANPALGLLFKSPIVQGDKKLAVVQKIFASSFNPLTISFLEIVIKKKREFYIPDIVIAFIGQYNEINKIAKAKITTAVSVSDAVIGEVKAFIEKQIGKTVILESAINPEIIGGLVIQMEDKLYDASISGKLRKAKQDLLNTYISK